MATSAPSEFDILADACRATIRRPMGQWAEEEIFIPSGEYRGQRFRRDRQPYTYWIYWAFEQRKQYGWSRLAFVGGKQSGKTLNSFTIPILYYLCEMQETIGAGIPQMDMASDKWKVDIKPAMALTRYADIMPTKGPGSRGGLAGLMEFSNNAWLKFFPAGGSDAQLSGFTTRILIKTEIDKYDEQRPNSREGSPSDQMDGRLEAYSRDQVLIVEECTMSNREGLICTRYADEGTRSRIGITCPGCKERLVIGRVHLRGWREAKSAAEAKRNAHWACHLCGATWGDDERREMLREGRLVHYDFANAPRTPPGIDDDMNAAEIFDAQEVAGPWSDTPRETETFSYRWGAFENLFKTAPEIAAREWEAAQYPEDDSKLQLVCQDIWALPWNSDAVDMSTVTIKDVMARMGNESQGILPRDTEIVTGAIDVGKWKLHWGVVGTGQRYYLGNYGVHSTTAGQDAEDHAIRQALRELREQFEAGLAQDGRTGTRAPDLNLVDARYHTDVVMEFCRESGPAWLPYFGFGVSQRMSGRYSAPKQRSKAIKRIGDQWYLELRKANRTFVINGDADHWKSQVHDALTIPAEQTGALMLYASDNEREHMQYARHITAEVQREVYIEGQGTKIVWEQTKPQNHLLDVTYMAMLAADCVMEGVAGGNGSRATEQTTQQRRGVQTPDGRPYLITDR